MPEEGVAKFRPRARLLSILGNELIRDEVIAVVELAKNAYDADASYCKITLNDVGSRARGRIEVADDGIGMTKDQLLGVWLEPARDNKSAPDGQRPRTAKGRFPLGEKGIGRLATDKLGEDLEIITRAAGSDSEAGLFVEGGRFTKEKYLDEVEVRWKAGPPGVFAGSDHGTVLRITQLRTDWTRDMVLRVHQGLGGLSSPISGARDFVVSLHSNEYPEFTGKVSNPLLPLAHYRMSGEVDDHGELKFKLDDGEESTRDLRADDEGFNVAGAARQKRDPTCGPLRLAFYVWDKDAASLKRVGMDAPKRELLGQLCGIRIYRDGFRVWPYGELGDDWLELNKRRVQNPGLRVGTDRIIGYIEISQSRNPYLRDKSNREGLIESGNAYGDLRRMVANALEILEDHRFRLIPHLSRAKLPRMVDILADIRREFQAAPDFLKALDRVEKLYTDDVELYQQRVDSLLAIAGIGMTAERLTHEFAISIRLTQKLLEDVTGKVRGGRVDVVAVLRDLAKIADQLSLLDDQIRHLEPLYYSRKQSVSEVDVSKAAEDVKYLFGKSLSDSHVNMEIVTRQKLVVRANKGHVLQVLINLLDNALYWLKANRIPQPRIMVEVRGADRKVIFADNGLGIQPRDTELIFEPFYTRKKDGRGLGLFIAREVLSNYRAKLNLVLEGQILSGANFVIDFKEFEAP